MAVGCIAQIHCLQNHFSCFLSNNSHGRQYKKTSIASPATDSPNTPRAELLSNHALLHLSLSATDCVVASGSHQLDVLYFHPICHTLLGTTSYLTGWRLGSTKLVSLQLSTLDDSTQVYHKLAISRDFHNPFLRFEWRSHEQLLWFITQDVLTAHQKGHTGNGMSERI